MQFIKFKLAWNLYSLDNRTLIAVSQFFFYSSIFLHYFLTIPYAEVYFNHGKLDQVFFYILYCSILIFSIFAAFNWHYRLSTFVVFVVHSVLLSQNDLGFWGWGQIAHYPLFYFFALSFIKNHSHYAFFHRSIFLIHLSSIYFATSLGRLSSVDWIEGNVLLYVLENPIYSRVANLNLFPFKFALSFFCHFALYLEIIGAVLFLIFNQNVRRILSFFLILFHLLLFSTKIQIWSPFMISLLLLGWVSDESSQEISVKKIYAKAIPLQIIFYLFFSGLTYAYYYFPGYSYKEIYPLVKTKSYRAVNLFQSSTQIVGSRFEITLTSANGIPKTQTYYAETKFWADEWIQFLERLSIYGKYSDRIAACRVLKNKYGQHIKEIHLIKQSLRHTYPDLNEWMIEKKVTTYHCSDKVDNNAETFLSYPDADDYKDSYFRSRIDLLKK
jgi:hypothetical protein